MNFPFYYKTSINTNLSEQAVRDKLFMNTLTKSGRTFKDKKAIVQNTQQFKLTGKNYLYKSTISENKFILYRVLEGPVNGGPRNSFLPFCFGSFNQLDKVGIITLKFRPAKFILILMLIWTSGVVFGTLAIFTSSLQDGKYKEALLTPIILSPFYVGFWFFQKFGFKNEVEKTLFFLNNIGLTTNGV